MHTLATYYTLSQYLVSLIDTIPKRDITSEMRKKRQLSMHEIAKVDRLLKQATKENNLNADLLELEVMKMGKGGDLLYRVLTEKPKQTTQSLLTAYLNNEIGVMDSSHKKILKTITKL
jgi:excinuclease UvrABC helicase subunit UvrB